MKFNIPLIEGIIVRRDNRFIMSVNLEGEIIRCHSPVTGRIGTIDVVGRPCLLSFSNNPNRATKYTVEAISLNKPTDKQKTWIGINQNAANKYVEYFLKNNAFDRMIATDESNLILREQILGKSKLDFLVGNTYLEVKTPLMDIQLQIPNYVKYKKVAPLASTDRFMKHMEELGGSLGAHERAILLLVFMYDNPGFRVISHSANYKEIHRIIGENLSRGVEVWQANLKITHKDVTLQKYFQIPIENIMR